MSNNSRYIEYPNDDAAIEAEAEIVAELGEDELFTDSTFPTTGSSIYHNEYEPFHGGLPANLIQWLRINSNEINEVNSPMTFIEGVESGDVIQGALGDCWLISALSIIATRPKLLKNIIVSDENKHKGIYTLKFFKEGKWIYTHIDDHLPCNVSSNILFAHCKNMNEMYISIIEKGYAKIHGCYENLISGFIDYALRDFTGNGTIKLKFTNNKIKKKIKNGTLFNELKQWINDGSLLGCSLGGKGVEQDQGMGILAGHAYSILDIQEVQAEATDMLDELNEKLLKIRNPWGMGEWKGDWCDNDIFWEDYPEISQDLNPHGFKNDGTFWMTWTDFKEQFNQVFLCIDFKGDDEIGQRYEGTWIPGDRISGSGGMPKYPTFLSNPHYPFTIYEPTKLLCIVNQSDERFQTGNKANYTQAIGFVVVKLSDDKPRLTKYVPNKMVGMSRTFAPTRSVAGLIRVDPGRYACIPTQYKPNNKKATKFILEIFSDNSSIEFDEEGMEVVDLDDLEESDDEDVDDLGTYDLDEADEEEPENNEKSMESIHTQISDLALYIKQLQGDLNTLLGRVEQLEETRK